jgi:glycerol-3-phosphate acyltransferase PlsX
MDVMKQEIKGGGLRAKIGYLFLKKVFKRIKTRLNYTDVGGSPFLGINEILVKSHGSSKAKTIYSCVLQVMDIYKSNYIEKMREGIKNSSMAEEE